MGLHFIGGKTARRFFVGTTGQTANQQTYTFTNHAIGDAHATRYVVVCIHWSNGLSLSRNLSSVTIGGVTASIIRQDVSPTNTSFRSAIVGLAVAAGTTATIVVNIATGTATSCAISVYALRDLESTTPFHSNGSGTQTGTSVSSTLNVPAKGIAIASITNSTSGTNVTVSGLTEDADLNNSDARATPASRERLTAETARAISASGASSAWAMTLASWG